MADFNEAREREAFEAYQSRKLKSNWLYDNPNGHEIVDSMMTVIAAEIDGYKQDRAGEYVSPWIETKWRGWRAHAKHIAGVQATATSDGLSNEGEK